MEDKSIRMLLAEYDRISQKNGDAAMQMMQAIMLGDQKLQKQIAVRMQLRQIVGHAISLGQYRRAAKLLFVLQQMESQHRVAEDELNEKLGKKMCAE